MRITSSLLVAFLVFSSLGFADQPVRDSEPQQEVVAETSQASIIKAEVRKRGAGEKSRVRVTLAKGTVVKGYIGNIEESSFDVNGNKMGQATSISYADVQRIQGPGLSKGSKIAIVVAIGVAVVVAVGLIGYAKSGLWR